MSDIDVDDLKKLEDDYESSSGYKKKGKPVKGPVYKVKLEYSSETEVCFIDRELNNGDYVIVNSRYGKDLAVVLGKVRNVQDIVQEDVVSIIRVFNKNDKRRLEENKQKEKKAYHICKEKIEKLRLDMKLTGVHYLLDEPKILFYFTADNRVDFRELVKELVALFKMRIELRQIGVRDESRLVGGVGVCGRVLCCHGLADNLKPVSIKMAKEQNLSLNSMKISGPCGRLLCCLAYEFDFYEEEKAKLPSVGSRVGYNKKGYKVEDVNIFSKIITVNYEHGRLIQVPFNDLVKKGNRWEIAKIEEE